VTKKKFGTHDGIHQISCEILTLNNETGVLKLQKNTYVHDLFLDNAPTKLKLIRYFVNGNGTAHFKNCKQSFEYELLLLLRDIWWSKFRSVF
jgi:hypothetical protein